MIEDYHQLRAALNRLGQHVQIAVDDAGAGFASMRHILELGPTFAKLDISLVRGIDADNLRQALAAGLTYYALRTGCRLIAEGVETQAEADTLTRLGIELGQGYLYGRPMPVADLA
jgi:EAL domain-containing protein (putative c-di-GMP-specific phosphodiesterase class I)